MSSDAKALAVLLQGRREHIIYIGGVCASREPTVVQTVLGSCIAVCLRDPLTMIGGMNHFMLPMSHAGEDSCARYGVHAMELLINECMNAGAERNRLEAKVFGGGHVLRTRETDGNVPQSNIRFALKFLATEDIPVVSRDIGGNAARKVLFFTDSGRVLLKRLQRDRADDIRQWTAIESQERAGFQVLPASRPASRKEREADGSVTLF